MPITYARSIYFLCNVHVQQLQLDEMYAVWRGVKGGEISEEKAIKRLERSRHWVWTAIDPVSKLLLAIEVGPWTVEMAQRLYPCPMAEPTERGMGYSV